MCIKKLMSFFQREKHKVEIEFFKPILFEFPQLLKSCSSKNVDINKLNSDYLSKNDNIKKYVFSVCEQIQIAGVSWRKYQREIVGHPDIDFKKDIAVVVVRAFEKEARLMLRRLLELFLESWGFSKSVNKEEEIRYYFLIRALQVFTSRKIDRQKFCNIVRQDDVKKIKEIQNELNNLVINTPSYLRANKSISIENEIKDLKKSFRVLLLERLPSMTEKERFVIGPSYRLYAESSEVIHGYSGGIEFVMNNVQRELDAIYARIALLSFHILKHLSQIGGDILDCQELISAINGFKTDVFSGELDIQIGDKVLVRKQIKAKVIDIQLTQYGCKLYNVEYIDKSGTWTFSFSENILLREEIEKIR